MSQSNDLRWLYQCLRPQGSNLGLSGGIGPIQGGPGCPPMSKAAIALHVANGFPRPNMFTGKWGGVLYYKGKVWEGPTNTIGTGNLTMIDRAGAGWGIRGIG